MRGTRAARGTGRTWRRSHCAVRGQLERTGSQPVVGRTLDCRVARALAPEGRLIVFGPHGKGREMIADLRKYGFAAVDEAKLLAMKDAALDDQLWAGIVFRYVGVQL